MKLNVSKSELKRVMNAISKIVTKHNTLPILSTCLLIREGDVYTLTSSSGDQELTMNVNFSMVVPKDFFPVCLPVAEFFSALATLPEQPLTIVVEEDSYNTIIEYQGGQFTFKSYSPVEFPLMRSIEKATCAITLPMDVFLPCVKSAAICTSKDVLRPIFGNVAIDVKQDGVTFAGTDGHVLYKFDHHHGVPFIKEGTEQLIPLPASVANSIDIIFGNSNEINVSADSSTMKLSSANATLAVRMCEQRYPNYNSVIRKESPYHVTIPVRDLLQTIKRISVMASESSQIIRIQKEGEQLVLSAIDPDFSRGSKESVAFTEANIPEGFEIAFNHNNLSKLLITISTDNVRLEFESSSASILLKEDAPNSALTEMCMPIVA